MNVPPPTTATEPEPRTTHDTAWIWARSLATAIVLALVIRTFFLGVFWIPTGSMEPTLFGADGHKTGDRIVVLRFSYGVRLPLVGKYIARWGAPERGDIVVFTTGSIPKLSPNRDLIKRVVGLPGDTVEIVPDGAGGGDPREGFVYVNGRRPTEPAVRERRYVRKGAFAYRPLTLAPGQYLVLGDNTARSNDSRFWGPLPEDNVLGRAVLIYWPLGRVRKI